MHATNRRKVCVVLVDRANYGRLKPVMKAIAARPELQLQVLAGGTMVLERFGRPLNMVRADGFRIDGEAYIELEGSTPSTMAKSVGFGIVEFASHFHRLAPHVVLLIGDRYEALSAAIAAAFMNLCVVHVQGGEVSGSIDESTRHAMSKFAQYHFPSTLRARDYLTRMGEAPDTILGVGCPSSDIARSLDRTLTSEIVNSSGSGAQIDAGLPYLLVVFHPTTTYYGSEREQMAQLLEGLKKVEMQTILLWPNIDAGADHISKAVRVFRDRLAPNWLRTLTNVGPESYLKILANAGCAVGNSSSFVRDASFFGTPVVLVGDRQAGREVDQHVAQVEPEARAIAAAIRLQIRAGRFAPSTLYGDGFVSDRLAEALAKLSPYVQKKLHYVFSEDPDARAWSRSRQRRIEGYTGQKHQTAAG